MIRVLGFIWISSNSVNNEEKQSWGLFCSALSFKALDHRNKSATLQHFHIYHQKRDWSVKARASKHKWMSWIMIQVFVFKGYTRWWTKFPIFNCKRKCEIRTRCEVYIHKTTFHGNGLSTFPHLCDKAINTVHCTHCRVQTWEGTFCFKVG